MHEGSDTRDFPADVAADGTIRLVFDMIAPSTLGRHTETWVIVQGSTNLCSMSVTIDVVE